MKTIRVALIGPGGVGKSSMLRRLGGVPFDPRYFPTEGKEYHVVELPGVRFEVTEYAGQEQFRGITQEHDAYIVVATASKIDLKGARKLMRRMPKDLPYSFIVNKSDVRRLQSRACCSVKDNDNLLAPFQDIALQLNMRSRL